MEKHTKTRKAGPPEMGSHLQMGRPLKWPSSLLPAQSSCPLSPDWGSTTLSLPPVNTKVLEAPSASWKISQTIGWSLPANPPCPLLLLRHPWDPQHTTTSSLCITALWCAKGTWVEKAPTENLDGHPSYLFHHWISNVFHKIAHLRCRSSRKLLLMV